MSVINIIFQFPMENALINSARNGQYIGKYQLSAGYLNGDYSAANQERVANNYVNSRYGSWSAAKAHWESTGWY